MPNKIIQTPDDLEAIAHLNLAVIRILVAKGLIQKEELLSELPRHQPSEGVAFALYQIINKLPDQ